MIEVELNGENGRGVFVLIDNDDFERVASLRWHVLSPKGSLTRYARASANGRTVYLHRFIMRAEISVEVDHIDGNGLNNQKENLRIVTHQENLSAAAARKSKLELDRLFDEWDSRL